MDFEDSFFQSSSSGSEEGECNSNIYQQVEPPYVVKKCESKWFMDALASATGALSDCESIHGVEFAVCKHQADLLYNQGGYTVAAELYEQLLAVVPASNACVTREVRDGLARCYLKLGEAEKAIKEAEKLVAHPHEKDWSSWKLISQCHSMLQDHAAEVLALQTSASLQRCHSNFWVCLSQAYRKLCTQTLCDCGSTDCSISTREAVTKVLAQIVQLFRPYFTWRNQGGVEDVNGSDSSASSEKLTASNGLPSSTHQHTPFSAHQSCGEVTCECLSCRGCDDTVGTRCQGFQHPNDAGRNCCSNNCAEACVFSGAPASHDLSYVQTLRKLDFQILPKIPGLVPTLDLPVCHFHSPFVMLLRQRLHPDEFVALSDALHEDGLSGMAHQLWASVLVMAECSSLVWARHVLEYSARHSHSFPKEAVQSQLRKVEQALESCAGAISSFLLTHFSKKMVFEDHQQIQ